MPSIDASSVTATVFICLLHLLFSFFFLNIFIGTIQVTFSARSGKSLITGSHHKWDRCVHAREFRPVLTKAEAARPLEGAACITQSEAIRAIVLADSPCLRHGPCTFMSHPALRCGLRCSGLS